MTVRLVKRQDIRNDKRKTVLRPTQNDAVVTTKAWVEEFKANKKRNDVALLEMAKRI